MEQQKLPNATISLVLAIISFLGCCCFGIGGIIPSAIALYLANKDKKKYEENPELYSNYKQVNTARTVAIIALVISSVWLIYTAVNFFFFGGVEAYETAIEQFKIEMDKQQSMQN